MSDRLDLLARDVERAAAELGLLGSTDPMAHAARQAIRLAEHTLRTFWLPALELDGALDGS